MQLAVGEYYQIARFGAHSKYIEPDPTGGFVHLDWSLRGHCILTRLHVETFSGGPQQHVSVETRNSSDMHRHLPSPYLRCYDRLRTASEVIDNRY